MSEALTLFDAQLVRDDDRPKRNAETDFLFLSRVNDTAFAEVRSTLERWFARFPAGGRIHLRNEFRSGNPGKHAGAVWELYLHEAFRRLGFEIELEPELPGVAGRPDFLLRKEGVLCAVEATVVSEPPSDPLLQELLDAINDRPHPDFAIGVRSVLARVDSAPPRRPILRQIDRHLNTLDWDEVSGRPMDRRWSDTFTAASAGWCLELRAIPRAAAWRGRSDNEGIWVYQPEFGVVDNVDPLKGRLGEKARGRSRIAVPFVIAVGLNRGFQQPHQPVEALFGDERLLVRGDASEAVPIRVGNGAWTSSRGWTGDHVSAVITAVNVRAEWLGALAPIVWHHPGARRPLGLAQLPWEARYLPAGADQLATRSATSPPRGVIGLADDWPGEFWNDRRAAA